MFKNQRNSQSITGNKKGIMSDGKKTQTLWPHTLFGYRWLKMDCIERKAPDNCWKI